MKKSMLSIVIPAHNEASRIAQTLEDYLGYFSSRYYGAFEIIVVPNGCLDETSEIVATYGSKSENIKQHCISRAGKGRALREGFKIAKGDKVSFTDADGATSPQEIARLAEQLGDDDGVIGSRWLPGSKIIKGQGLARNIASRGFNFLVRVMFTLPYKDTQCSAKVFKQSALNAVMSKLKAPGFTFDVELIYKLRQKGYKIKEIAITWEDKRHSKLNLLAEIPKMLIALFWLRLSNLRMTR
jgi:dolichol-phosphate mannosyltransferase